MSPNELDLKHFLLRILSEHGEKTAFSIFRKEWIHNSFRDVVDLSIETAKIIREAGLSKKDNVAIIMDSCPEYASAFFASGLDNHTTLLLDSKLSPEEMKSILIHSDSKLIITGFSARAAVEKLQAVLPEKLPVVLMDNVKRSGHEASTLEKELSHFDGLKPKDIAVLVYTSGTTSEPKGVMLTLESIFFNGRSVVHAVGPNPHNRLLSILPLNHMFEFNCGMLAQLHLGSHVVYANTMLPHEILERLQAFAYTDMIVVPLFLRSIRSALMREIKKSILKRIYFELAFALSRFIRFQSFRRFIFAPVIKKFGGIGRFLSGGAALDAGTQRFFTLMGITVGQGYGLTETSPVCTVNYKGDKIMGCQGKAVPGTEVKIDSVTGEVLIRGPHVMKGYYKKPELNTQVFTDDGWFKTGDIGTLDKKGNLFITGRLKELIVLGNGKKVFPDEVENIMKISDNIKEVIIVGANESSGPLKNTESVCAVVVPSDELMKSSDELTIRELIEKEIRKNTEKIAAYKRPSRIFLAYQELPKTNTRKNKRMVIKRMIEEGAFL
jgi:long-chain acyl-CoA synthetase